MWCFHADSYVVFSCGLLKPSFISTVTACVVFSCGLLCGVFHADSYVVFSCGLLCGVFMRTPMWCFHADSLAIPVPLATITFAAAKECIDIGVMEHC